MQLFNCINWPKAFTDYCIISRGTFATTFHMLLKLRKQLQLPIAATKCTKASKNYIEYVNFEKRKVLPDFSRAHDPLWNLSVEQDASESVNYFFNMIVEAEKPTQPIPALTITRRNKLNVAAMQRWTVQNSRTTVDVKLKSNTALKSHVAGEEKHYILTLDLESYKPRKNDSVMQLQSLIDIYFAKKDLRGVQCKHCRIKHSLSKHPEITATSSFSWAPGLHFVALSRVC